MRVTMDDCISRIMDKDRFFGICRGHNQEQDLDRDECMQYFTVLYPHKQDARVNFGYLV